MSTELAKPSDAEFLAGIQGAGNFIPAILLLHPMSDPVVQKKGEAGNYWFEETDLGDEVTIVVCDRRWHSIYIEDGTKKLESYKFESPITDQIKAINRKAPKIDSRWGHSWLVFLPDQAKFAVFHPNTPSARPVSAVLGICTRPIDERQSTAQQELPYTHWFKLTSLIKPKPVKHFCPKATPIERQEGRAPSEEQAKLNVKLFQSAVEQEPEYVESTDSTAPAADR